MDRAAQPPRARHRRQILGAQAHAAARGRPACRHDARLRHRDVRALLFAGVRLSARLCGSLDGGGLRGLVCGRGAVSPPVRPADSAHGARAAQQGAHRRGARPLHIEQFLEPRGARAPPRRHQFCGVLRTLALRLRECAKNCGTGEPFSSRGVRRVAERGHGRRLCTRRLERVVCGPRLARRFAVAVASLGARRNPGAARPPHRAR